jgi:hypothetical protein
MDTYVESAEAKIDNLCLDLFITALTAAQGRLSTKAADRVALRLRSAASVMVEDRDSELLKAAADKLSAVSLRVKSQADRQRAKAAKPPTQAQLAAEWDKWSMERW